MNSKVIARLEELQHDYDAAVANGQYALADQIDMEMNYIIDEEVKRDEED